MTDACRAWMRLSDRAAVGDWLAPNEFEFLKQHARECESCGGEAELWSTLEGVLENPALLSAPVLPRAPIRPSLGQRVRELWGRRKRSALVLAVSGAAAAAAWFALRSPSIERMRSVERGDAAGHSGAWVALVTGEVRVNGEPSTAGRVLAQGDVLSVGEGHACVLVPPGVSACAGSRSVVAIERLEPAARRLGLREGHLVARLAHQPAGATFGVETSAGPAIAKGTIFAVETSGDDVWLRVHEGTVLAGRAEGERSFSAPSGGLLAATARPEPLSVSSAAHDARLIELTRVAVDESAPSLVVPVPSSAPAASGAPAPSVLAPVPPASSGGVSAAVGERLPPNQVAPQTSAELLAQARELRRQGRFTEAAAAYQRLRNTHPQSAEARASLVSLGELQLSQLKDARAALGSFDAYLRGGGALTQEARYGRIRALRQLGRLAEERAAIESFLADYPRSVQSAPLRARLSEGAP